jgi:hypothetical protein
MNKYKHSEVEVTLAMFSDPNCPLWCILAGEEDSRAGGLTLCTTRGGKNGAKEADDETMYYRKATLS